MKTALIGIVLAAIMAIGVTGCGSSKSACAEAMGQVYTMGCQTALPGTPADATEQELIDGCNGYKTLIDNGTCNCKTAFDAGLNCLKTITSANCAACENYMGTLTECMGTNCTT
jgi:hypothetical protein